MSFVDPVYLPFLVVVLMVYYGLPQRGRIFLLLLASYAFYMSWKPEYAGLLLFSTCLDYVGALRMESAATRGRRRFWLGLSICGNLGLLAYFKYTGFALENLQRVFQSIGIHFIDGYSLQIILPIGISFYTFQTLSYAIDVYRGRIPAERRFDLVACYVAFFPQLVAGPIERARNLLPQLREKQPLDWNNFRRGGQLILWGLIKKCVFADRFAYLGFDVALSPNGYNPVALLTALALLSIWLYLDFSSYTDIARGSARLLGIELMENFRRPYLAKSLPELWSRWHISLTSWVNDYLLLPLMRWLPRRWWAAPLAIFLTMVAVGAWHGAQWNFIVWGGIHGLLLAGRHTWKHFHRSPVVEPTGWVLARKTAVTQGLWLVTGIFFAAPGIRNALEFYTALFVWRQSLWHFESLLFAGTWIPIIIAFYLFHALKPRFDLVGRLNHLSPSLRAAAYVAAFYLLLFGSFSGNQAYYYFQF